MDIKIRKAEITDIDLLMKWRMRVLHEVFAIPDNQPTKELDQEMPSPDNLSGQCAYLMNIYTYLEFRGRGVGEISKPGRKLYEKIGFVDMPDMMKL